MTTAGLHPAVVIACLAFSVVGLSVLARGVGSRGDALLAAMTLGGLALVRAYAPARGYLLLRRIRWLLFALVLVAGLTVPGRTLPGIAWLTIEGLETAMRQSLLLVAVTGLLALTLQHFDVSRLAGATLAWLTALGFGSHMATRLAVRLALVVESAASADFGKDRNVAEALRQPERWVPAHDVSSAIAMTNSTPVQRSIVRLLGIATMLMLWIA